jgi:hypothetical protein
MMKVQSIARKKYGESGRVRRAALLEKSGSEEEKYVDMRLTPR